MAVRTISRFAINLNRIPTPMNYTFFHFYKARACLHSSACLSTKNDTNDEKNFGSSSIIMQDGLYIQELPIIVRKVNDVPAVLANSSAKSDDDDPRTNMNFASSVQSSASKLLQKTNELSKNEINKEEAAIQDGLSRCSSLSEIFKLLEVIPVEEVTPGVATCAMKCISAFTHNNAEIRKQTKDSLIDFPHEGVTETFAWNAVLDRLCAIICSSPDVYLIVEALQAANKANLITSNTPHHKLLVECLVRVTDGKVDVNHICDLISILQSLSGENAMYTSYLDKLWVGIANNFSNINEHNIAKIYFVLPAFKKPQKILLNMLEKRTYACWWKLKSIDVINILSALVKIGNSPNQLLVSLTKWLHLNIHSLSESDVSNAMKYIIALKHYDNNICQAMEKYAKARNTNIRDVELIATFADFAFKFRLCSTTILDTLALCFVNRSAEFEPTQMLRIVRVFGGLGHTPVNDVDFFTILEDVLALKFTQFKPEEIIELLLSCTFIQRYPLNFVTKIFNPFFLENLKSIRSEFELRKTRNNLKLLDTTMSLECPQYRGPLLNKDRSVKSLSLDVRLAKMQKDLFDDISDILGGENRLAVSECIPNVPFTDIYLIDFAFHLDSNGKPIPYTEKGFTIKKAVVITLPEHFTMGKRQLVGLQSTRMRHLRALDYEVIQLEYDIVNKLKMQPACRREYLRSVLLN